MNAVLEYLTKPFSSLNHWRNKAFLVLFCGCFASFFIYYFNPFNIEDWQFSSLLAQNLSIHSMGIIGVLVLLFSQFVLRPLLGYHTFNRGTFILWFLFELFLLTTVNFLIFGSETPTTAKFLKEYWLSFKYTSSILVLPYSIALLILSVQEKTDNLVSNLPPNPLLRIEDENDKLVLSVALENILFLKSESNYVAVHYLEGNTLKKKLVRSSLKKLEGEINKPQFFRTHRSYMVNLNKITAVNPTKKGHELVLSDSTLKVPVSSSYKAAFEEQMDLS